MSNQKIGEIQTMDRPVLCRLLSMHKSSLNNSNSSHCLTYSLDNLRFLPKLFLPRQDGLSHVTECVFSASILHVQRFPARFHVKFGIGGLFAGIFGQPSFQLRQSPESVDDRSVGDRIANNISFVPRLRACQACQMCSG